VQQKPIGFEDDWDFILEPVGADRPFHEKKRRQVAVINNIAANDIIELAIPFDLLGVKANDEVQIFVTLNDRDRRSRSGPTAGISSSRS
jgi:hypothetical protein